jgi:hypothetical protein
MNYSSGIAIFNEIAGTYDKLKDKEEHNVGLTEWRERLSKLVAGKSDLHILIILYILKY